MNKSTILFVGFSENLNVLEKQFATGWISNFAESGEAAIEKFQQLNYDVVIVSKTIDGLETLKKIFMIQQPQLLFIQTEGVPDASDILQQLTTHQKENKPAINYKDDTLKNAGLNINIQ